MVARLVARARERGADGGFTMIDLMVTMTIMSIVMVMFSSSIYQIYNAEQKTESTSSAQSQIVTAFQRLDKSVRYASGISTPAVVSGDAYVEYLTSATGTPTCTELRVHVSNNQLQSRTWTQGASPLVPSAWRMLASGITATTPFTFSPADATFGFQRLEVKLTSTSGSNNNATSRQSDITFTALNTSSATSSTSVCVEGRVIP